MMFMAFWCFACFAGVALYWLATYEPKPSRSRRHRNH